MLEKIENLDVDLLDLPPSCIEFWPDNHSWLIVGTYELDKSEDPARTGEKRLQHSDVDIRPFTYWEGSVTSGLLSFHNYSRPDQASSADDNESYDDDGKYEENQESGNQTQPSTLQERNGSLMLYNLQNGALKLHQSRPYPYGAIYDLHFCPTEPDLFAVSSSTGRISFFRIQDNGNPVPDIVHIKTWKVFDDSVLITYFAWCPLPQAEGTKSLVIAASTGVIQLITVTGNLRLDSSGNDLRCQREEPAISLHSLKVPYVGEEPQYAYCCVWNPAPGGLSNNFSGVFSGGDDSKLRTGILGSSMEADDNFHHYLPTTFSGHDAAVISILPLPCVDKRWILLTGSYDNKVRILTMDWDSQTKQKSIDVSAILDVGGGAYRLEFLQDYTSQPTQHSNLHFQVLATCMEAGVKILDIQRNEGTWNINIIASADIEASKSHTPGNTTQLCYASAVQQLAGSDDIIFVSSCFTKRQLGVYRFLRSWKIR
ncbi:hypothetical protein ACMFMG_008536 [Clarireedia jacksonii]